MALSGRHRTAVFEKIAEFDNKIFAEGTPQTYGVPHASEAVRIYQDFDACVRRGVARTNDAEPVAKAEVIRFVRDREALEQAAPIHFNAAAPEHDLTSAEGAVDRLPAVLVLLPREIVSADQGQPLVYIELENRPGTNLEQTTALGLRPQAKVPHKFAPAMLHGSIEHMLSLNLCGRTDG